MPPVQHTCVLQHTSRLGVGSALMGHSCSPKHPPHTSLFPPMPMRYILAGLHRTWLSTSIAWACTCCPLLGAGSNLHHHTPACECTHTHASPQSSPIHYPQQPGDPSSPGAHQLLPVFTSSCNNKTTWEGGERRQSAPVTACVHIMEHPEAH
jgi:hypothetical protein